MGKELKGVVNLIPMQVVHAILRLLIPLSSLPEFRPRLYSCTLLTDLLKLPMTAITVSTFVLCVNSPVIPVETLVMIVRVI